MRQLAQFGPGGNSDSFRNAGFKSTVDAPRFVRQIGLDAYEYEAGRGISGDQDTLRKTGDAARTLGISMSFHTPYFISLSSVEYEKRLKSVDYIRESLEAAELLGAHTIVIHAGSCAKISREQAMTYAKETLDLALSSLDTHGIILGIETMGKINQLGTLDEVIEICKMDKALRPVVDFGHLNARELGGVFPNEDAYLSVFEKIGEQLGESVAKDLHCHFSKIEWTAAGEKRHLTFEDTVFGPDPEPLMGAIAKFRLTPTLISESAGTQSEDAAYMKRIYTEKRLAEDKNLCLV